LGEIYNIGFTEPQLDSIFFDKGSDVLTIERHSFLSISDGTKEKLEHTASQ